MPVVSLIFGEQSGILRRVVVADSLADLDGHYGDGEAMLVVLEHQVMRDGLPDAAAATAMIERFTGKPSEAPRCIVIDDKTGDVEKAILADPSLDTVEGKTLFQHPDADKGWELDGEGEYARPAELDEGGDQIKAEAQAKAIGK